MCNTRGARTSVRVAMTSGSASRSRRHLSDADHKGAHEYLGELYVETGDLASAREQLAVLTRLCPQGCEERKDLEEALASATPKTN